MCAALRAKEVGRDSRGGAARARSRAAATAIALLLAGCTTPPKPAAPPPAIKTVTEARYDAVAFEAIPALADTDLVAAWPALLASCRRLAQIDDRRNERAAENTRTSTNAAADTAFKTGRGVWSEFCGALAQTTPGAASLRALLAAHLQAWRISAVTRDASANAGTDPRIVGSGDRGRITGYYEPELNGNRVRAEPFVHPLHRVPDDLLTVDLGALYPELAGKRVRGRLDGKRVVPYWSRSQIDDRAGRLAAAELFWVDDAVDAFLLQVQGSGRVRLPDGNVVRVGYADTNGHPYHSIGRILVERGELTVEGASLQGIRAWARANPQRVTELLHQNPSYVFFREVPLGDPAAGPVGAFNVALTPGYSVAVDPQFIALGSPVVVSTAHPTTGAPLVRLMAAQDVGGAIRGPLRFDFFWGFGNDAGQHAGRQRHDVQAWLLAPKRVRPEELLGR